MTSSKVERMAIARADSGISDRGCRLYQNGVLARADHAASCASCAIRLYLIARARQRAEWRVRDHNGRVISDWLI